MRHGLRARRAQQRSDRLAAGPKWTTSDLVFTTRNGTPIEPRNLNRAFSKLCRRADVRPVRFHDLRPTCASLLHEQGTDAHAIMDVYAFVRLDAQRAAFDRVGSALADSHGDSDGNGPGDPDGDDGAAGALAVI